MSLLGGIRPPIAVLSVLLLALAGVTALTLGRAGQEAVPKAVKLSQQHFAEDGAIALRASIDESVTDLTRNAELFSAGDPVPPDAVLDKIGSVYQKWRGTAVVEISSGKLLAARGENLPLTAIDRGKLADKDGLAPRMVRLEDGETRLLSFALLTWEGKPQQLLVASSSLRFPGISLGKFRSIAVVGQDGHILSDDGIADPSQEDGEDRRQQIKQADKQLKAFATTAAKKSRTHPIMSKEPGSGGFLGVSGHLTGDRYLGERAVAGYASLAGPEAGKATDATRLGLTVVAMVPVAEDSTATTSSAFGLLAAAALLLIGGVTIFLLLRTVQRPLIQLFLEGRRLTRGDLERPVSVPRRGEAARIGAALERLRRQLLGAPADKQSAPARRGRFGARTLIAVCAVLLLAWSAPLMLMLNRAGDSVVVPQQMVNDQRERTDTLTDRVRRALNEGHADLTSVASLIGDRTEASEMSKVLESTMHQHTRYQSLYVLDAKGKVLAKAGDDPRSPSDEGPSDKAVRVIDEGGKEPVIIGTAEMAGRDGAAVVGEFRIEFLNSLLKRPGLGQVRVVDAKRKVIGANYGYQEFESLPSGRLNALAEGTGQKVGVGTRPSGVLYRDGDEIQIAAAAPFAGGGAASSLGWTVVSWQPASGLAIPEYTLQNRTVLAGLLGITAAAACLGWLHIVVVRPLRHLADQAEALADGDRRTVLYPTHHDEVGAVTRSLELIRQQLPTGTQRKRDGATAGLAGRN
ncbi:HAMP domain-containing protein [Streptomyces sp. NRRL S-1521]|uniref:HAMP domain-containing protein n=1 Tax=Streptomyces sp. NRRL S-1521 TaxID=1609100 RepID=UPI00074A3453|nr:HAMP domain-containing protein [Streptomyces sp. NRRL S-1521]KUL62686.1 histidine kinase [Streptomyces sp. NRRL S-1521]